MNTHDFTKFGLKSLDKTFICKKSKPFEAIPEFNEFKIGDLFILTGFIVTNGRLDVIARSQDGCEDCIDHLVFMEHFDCLQSHKRALAGRQQGKKEIKPRYS